MTGPPHYTVTARVGPSLLEVYTAQQLFPHQSDLPWEEPERLRRLSNVTSTFSRSSGHRKSRNPGQGGLLPPSSSGQLAGSIRSSKVSLAALPKRSYGSFSAIGGGGGSVVGGFYACPLPHIAPHLAPHPPHLTPHPPNIPQHSYDLQPTLIILG